MTLTTSVIIPARGHSELLRGCLTAVAEQQLPLGEVVVVDDSDTGELGAIDGVRIVRSGGVGPYAARNTGWRTTSADVVLFADARSRPRPEWSARLVEHFVDGRVGFAGSDIRITSGPSWAARTAHRQQIFQLSRYLESSAHRPYFPTCNLAVRRSELERVGGFAEERSGADADLCWRILDGDGVTHAVTRDVLMDWVPRDELREYFEQFYRYGRSSVRLRSQWEEAGAPPPTPAAWPRLAVRAARIAGRLATSRVRRDQEETVRHLVSTANLAYDLGQRTALQRQAGR